VIKTLKNSCWLEITIKEGKKRQVRRMFEMIGHPVRKLKRTKIGFLKLEGLLLGEYRYLSSSEIELLKKEIQKA
jgi:23S rRNA pseudouridine2605 synthase